jgi:hypothetical protein
MVLAPQFQVFLRPLKLEIFGLWRLLNDILKAIIEAG